MTKRFFLLSVALLSCATPRPAAQVAASPAFRLERDVAQVAAAHLGADALWPGYDPLAIPLAVFDGDRTFLFRHPTPPDGFAPLPGVSPAGLVVVGRFAAMSANSSAEIGGVATATVLLDRPIADGQSRAPLAIHEAFHVFQRARHPRWIGNEADLFVYPTDDAGALALRRLETVALRRALAADAVDSAAGWTRLALDLRRDRFARLDSASVAYERGTELNEGLATYVEGKAAGKRTVSLPDAEFGPADVRRRAYAIGPALARLLDRFAPGWPHSFEADDRQTLDGALSQALGTGKTGAFPDADRTAAERQAQTDIETLAVTRAEQRAAFSKRPGWHVVVEADGNSLWPQGFDPINVERVGPTSVLHARFLRVGNGAGSLEVLDSGDADLEALTEGVGPHPLFNGVSRVEIVGLAQPETHEADGVVTVRVPGFTATFRGAHLTRTGTVITIRLSA